jgi:type VI secretion system protein ImpF
MGCRILVPSICAANVIARLSTVEDAISKFEPRLADVRVSLEPLKEHDRNVRFRVDALLKMDPALAPVTFDTVLRLNTQEYVVESQG